MRHVVDCIRRYLKVLSCFSPERFHRLGKQVGAFACSNMQRTQLGRTLRLHLERNNDESRFHEFGRGTVLKRPRWARRCREWGIIAVEEKSWTSSHVGTARNGDLLLWLDRTSTHARDFRAGFACGFVLAAPGGASDHHVILQELQHVSAFTFSTKRPTWKPVHLSERDPYCRLYQGRTSSASFVAGFIYDCPLICSRCSADASTFSSTRPEAFLARHRPAMYFLCKAPSCHVFFVQGFAPASVSLSKGWQGPVLPCFFVQGFAPASVSLSKALYII